MEHRRTTPYWPQANGEVERVNGMIEKHLKISQLEGTEWKWDLRISVLMYNSTPHTTTGVAPSVLMFGRIIRDKLPALSIRPNKLVEEIQDRDRIQKQKSADYTNNRRRAKHRELKVGDVVLVKRMMKQNKLASTFIPEEWMILNRTGSDVTLRSKESNRVIHRNVAHLKLLEIDQGEASDEGEVSDEGEASDEGEMVEEEIIMNSPAEAEADIPMELPEEKTKERPRRMVKKPGYLQDYKINQCH